MTIFWQNQQLLCEPAAKLLHLECLGGNAWVIRCLGQEVKVRAADLAEARTVAEKWFVLVLRELARDVEALHAS